MLDIVGSYQDIPNREKWVGLIGSREPSRSEYDQQYKLGKTLAKSGYTVVSGLAKGLDEAAHLGALDAGGLTIAIVNTPLFAPIYPKTNQGLADRIRNSGCIIYPYNTRAREDKSEYPNHFIKRLFERDLLLAHLCPRIIITTSDKEVVKGGTRYAISYRVGKRLERTNSSAQYVC